MARRRKNRGGGKRSRKSPNRGASIQEKAPTREVGSFEEQGHWEDSASGFWSAGTSVVPRSRRSATILGIPFEVLQILWEGILPFAGLVLLALFLSDMKRPESGLVPEIRLGIRVLEPLLCLFVGPLWICRSKLGRERLEHRDEGPDLARLVLTAAGLAASLFLVGFLGVLSQVGIMAGWVTLLGGSPTLPQFWNLTTLGLVSAFLPPVLLVLFTGTAWILISEDSPNLGAAFRQMLTVSWMHLGTWLLSFGLSLLLLSLGIWFLGPQIALGGLLALGFYPVFLAGMVQIVVTYLTVTYREVD